jgi:tRNA(adenine34) deaminase
MQLALEQAHAAAANAEVPIGAVLTYANKVIATAHNQVVSLNDPSAHAEILVLRKAGKILENYRLLDCSLYVTLEPCAMCAMALVHARVERVIFASLDKKTGALGGAFNILEAHHCNHRYHISSDILSKPATQLLQDFFKSKRTNLASQ